MLRIKAFRTLALDTKDLEAAERFYTEVLGGRVVERYEPRPGSRRPREVMVQVGDFRVALADASAGDLRGFPHYTLIVDGFRPKEELLAGFTELGVTVESVRDHSDGRGYSCTIRDRDGHLLELWIGGRSSESS